MLCGSYIKIRNLANRLKKIKQRTLSFSLIYLTILMFLICLFMWFARFQTLIISEPQASCTELTLFFHTINLPCCNVQTIIYLVHKIQHSKSQFDNLILTQYLTYLL